MQNDPRQQSMFSRPSPADSVEPAGFWIRALANFIDGIFTGIIVAPLSILGGVFQKNKMMGAYGITTVATYIILYCIIGYFYSKKGALPGKKLLDLQVIDAETGRFLSFNRGGVRDIVGKGISMITLGIGFLMAAFRTDKRTLHDLLVGSRVIRIRRKHD
jgi:uncharacterized RDD family membrane protein YckC